MQWVRTSWTKESRGGESAACRNAAPIGFPLPHASSSLAHVVRMREENGFQPHDTLENLSKVDVQLREVEGCLRVFPRVQPLFALPPRRRRLPAVRLVPRQWVRWQLNYRFSSALGIRDWSYWLDTFNIAYGPVTTDLFCGTPDFFIDEQGPVR